MPRTNRWRASSGPQVSGSSSWTRSAAVSATMRWPRGPHARAPVTAKTAASTAALTLIPFPHLLADPPDASPPRDEATHEERHESIAAARDHERPPPQRFERFAGDFGRLLHRGNESARRAFGGHPSIPRRRRRACAAGQHVDAALGQLVAERFGEGEPERLRGAVGRDQRR